MKSKVIAFALAAILSVSACAQNGQQNGWGMGNKQTVGTGLGAVAGGFAGSAIGGGKGRIVTGAAGALLGALAGSAIGKSLDQSDMMYHERAVSQSYAAPLNQAISWSNPETGHSGTVTAVREGTRGSNLCRQYKQTIVVDGQAQTAYGTACKESDGTWTLQN